MLFNKSVYRTVIILVIVTLSFVNHSLGDQLHPEGKSKKLSTTVLGIGADAIQTHAPLKNFEVYLVAFHPHKDNPSMQMEAHHFCNNVNEDFMQCILFDDNTKEANLNGIEYIISENLYNTLPTEEKKYWHPHNYEILSGQLVAPKLPEIAEKALLKKKINSYGKTWHVWHTKNNKGPGDTLPLGAPTLAWSFNRDNELDNELLKERDKKFKIDTIKKRQDRHDFISLVNPQQGVNELKDKFNNTKLIPGVRDINNE